jgi:serpin B
MTTCFAAMGMMFAGTLIPQLAGAQDIRSLIQAYNASGLDLFHQLATKPGNIVFSPYSVGTAMAMARSGARGATEAQMARVLHHRLNRADSDAANGEVLKILNSYDKSAIAPSCAESLQWTGQRCEGAPAVDGRCPFAAHRESERCVALPIKIPASAKLTVANALVLAGKSRTVSRDYQNLVQDKYAAEVLAGVGLEEINDWINKKTEGKIPKMLEQLDPSARAILLNTVYFKAHWASTFSKSATKDDAFSLSVAQRVEVPMMQQTQHFAVVARQDYRAIRLPYDIESLAMIIALPNEVEGLTEVAKRFDADELSALMDALNTKPAKLVALAMPRFKMTFDAGLVPMFKQLGMTVAFDNRADFSGMTGRPAPEGSLKIDAIEHRTVIEVMEEGTEAAAATAAVFFSAAAMKPPRPEQPELFRADHPFLFFMTDRATGAVLFEGRIVDPSDGVHPGGK